MNRLKYGLDVMWLFFIRKRVTYLISTKLVFLVLNTHEKVTTYIPYLELLATNQIKLVNQKGSERGNRSRVGE